MWKNSAAKFLGAEGNDRTHDPSRTFPVSRANLHLNRPPIDFLSAKKVRSSAGPDAKAIDALEPAHFRFYASIKLNKTPQKDPIG